MSSALRFSARPVLAIALVLVALAPLLPMARAQEVGPSSGLPMPRFVSVRNAPVNVRVGPGTNYDIAFTFVRPGVPVEIVQEFDTWRRIRDVEGDEGWVHQNLVVGDRTAIVAPWSTEGTIALRVDARADAPVRAWLTPQMLVSVHGCDGRFCEISLRHTGEDGDTTTYSGFIVQETLWGVYAGEVLD